MRDRLVDGAARCRSAAAAARASSSSAAKRSRSSARSIESGDVPMIGTPASCSGTASLSGVCPPNWTITPSGFSRSTMREHVLERQRLEVQLVRGVVVRADRLGVAVDHDGLEPVFLEREGGVDAAVVELDALADPVRPAAEDHDLLARRSTPALVLVLVGRVEVRRVRRELGAAGVDHLVARGECPAACARCADAPPRCARRAAPGGRRRSPSPWRRAAVAAAARRAATPRTRPRVDDLADVLEEPRVDAASARRAARSS